MKKVGLARRVELTAGGRLPMLGGPMIALVLAILFSAAFAVAIRLAQTRGADMTVVGATNYLTAALFHAFLVGFEGLHAPHAGTVLIGVGGGIVYATAFFLLQGLMKKRGLSVTAAVMRLSVLVPVAVSLIAWRETASFLQAAGISLAVVSLPLLSVGPASPSVTGDGHGVAAASRFRGGSVALLVGLFVVNGLCLLSTRAFRQTGIRGEDSLFLLILFAAAASTACGVWAFQARAGGRRTLPLAASALPGVVIGVANALSNRFIVAALQKLPGIIVYPLYSALGLLVTVVVTWIIFREKLRPVEWIGMALAVGSIALVNAS